MIEEEAFQGENKKTVLVIVCKWVISQHLSSFKGRLNFPVAYEMQSIDSFWFCTVTYQSARRECFSSVKLNC